jgi:hypothetical protein
MKRLIDDPELAPEALRLAELVRQAEPFRPSASGKRRVSLRLREPRAASLLLRAPTLGAAVLVFGGAAAAAAVGYPWSGTTAPPLETVSASPAPAPHPVPQRHPAEAPAPRPAPPKPEPERPPQQHSRTVPAKPKAAGEDPAPVLDAIRALRKSGDPARAQKLLDAYLASNPRGALSEDALGLSIEAAAARRDPRAAEYARRYLALFPNGRFRAVALRAARR